MGAFRNREHLSIPNLRFNVNGEQIQEALKVRNSELSKEIGELQEEINKICKDRGVDPNEVAEAGEDQELHEGYMSKALSGANAPRHGAAVRELEKDLSKLKSSALRMSSLMWRIADFNRITKNLEKDRKFDLNYDELILLGF